MFKNIAYTILLALMLLIVIFCGSYKEQKNCKCNCDYCVCDNNLEEQDRYNEYEGWDY